MKGCALRLPTTNSLLFDVRGRILTLEVEVEPDRRQVTVLFTDMVGFTTFSEEVVSVGGLFFPLVIGQSDQ